VRGEKGRRRGVQGQRTAIHADVSICIYTYREKGKKERKRKSERGRERKRKRERERDLIGQGTLDVTDGELQYISM